MADQPIPGLGKRGPKKALEPLEQPAASPTHLMVPSRPFAEGGAIGSGSKGAERNPTAQDWSAVGPSQSKAEHSAHGAHRSVNSDQLAMFMTPQEIKDHYQVLDADRQTAYNYDREGSLTNREMTTGGDFNAEIPSAARGTSTPPEGGGWETRRARRLRLEHGSRITEYSHTREASEGPETDEQVWGRKLEESQLSPRDYADVHGASGSQEAGPPDPWDIQERTDYPSRPTDNSALSSTENWNRKENWDEELAHQADLETMKWDAKYGDDAPSLHDKIRESGVKSPVHLGTQFGSEGKPEVAGGHHRIAAAHDIDPNMLIPVLHHEGGIREARHGEATKYFKYT